MNDVDPAQPAKPTPQSTEPHAVLYDSGQLLQGKTEVLIQHGDAIYRLRATKQGKLILHK